MISGASAVPAKGKVIYLYGGLIEHQVDIDRGSRLFDERIEIQTCWTSRFPKKRIGKLQSLGGNEIFFC